MVNDHYLYAPNGVIQQDGQVMLPAVQLAQSLGCSITGQGLEEDIVMKQVAPPASAKVYEEEALYWVREAGDSLYFNTTTMYSWADQSREYVCTIGGHKFYL